MLVPQIPIWCWNILGETAQYFSQPVLPSVGGVSSRPLHGHGACLARYTATSRLGEHDGSVWTPEIQCGYVAELTPEGDYRCTRHHPQPITFCAWCDALKAAGSTKAYPGCHTIWREQGLPDWCCPAESQE